MTKYSDTNGNEYANATEALEAFLGDMPDLTDEETETVFQFTHYQATPAHNLDALAYGITYAGLDDRFAGDNYPVPTPSA